MSRERQITGLRPFISAILGNINAARVQPMNRLDPIIPTLNPDSQAKSNYSNQFRSDVSFSHIGLLYKVVPQK
jgi:hypothetical protein